MILERINLGIKNILEKNRVRYFQVSNSYILSNPMMLIMARKEKFRNIYLNLNKEMNIILTREKTRFFKLENHYILCNPKVMYQYKEQHFEKLVEKLKVLNPMNTLKRGYAIVKFQDKVVSDATHVHKNDSLKIDLRDGYILANVEKVGKK